MRMMNTVSPLSDSSYGSFGDVPVLPNGLSDSRIGFLKISAFSNLTGSQANLPLRFYQAWIYLQQLCWI